MGTADARHLLERAGIGARPVLLAELANLSHGEAVALFLIAAPIAAKTPTPVILADYVPFSRVNTMPEPERKNFQLERGVALRSWWVTEMLAAATPAEQLRERMTLFWHNHFTSSLQKVKSAKLMLDQNTLLRRHALGDFGGLLHAVSKDAAMVVYLDSATSRKSSPNENFAREVMELFTLGEGRYSEQDIKEAARAFTGWSIEHETGTFRWRPFQHDTEMKTVLGVTGRLDGDAVLDILLQRPETAELITRKLWREFVSPTPDAVEVRRIAERFRSSGYDIRTALRELFNSRFFWALENRATLVKSPVDWVVGNAVAFDPEESRQNADRLALALRNLGQDLFNPPNVKGWPGGAAWINSSTLLARKQFAERLMRRENRTLSTGFDLLDPRAQLK
jgi:uncharacterized protein (DUF1800 family)